MSTDPWSSDTPALLTRSLSHVVAGRIVLPGSETIPLDVEGGRLSFDETRSPRVMLNGLTCRVPTDPALLARIDPRTGARLELDAGYTRPGGAQDVHTIADLGLRSRPVSRPDDVMTLDAAGDEALVIDAADTNNGLLTAASTTAGMTALIQQAIPGVVPTVTGPTGAALASEQYDDRWQFLTDLADRIGARVYDNGLRAWFIAPAPVLAAANLDLATGPNGTITRSDATITRDGDGGSSTWANYVYLIHEWTDSGGVDRRIVSTRRITTGAYAAVAPNVKILKVERTSSITQALADASAAALVARTVTRGRSLTVTAVSAYWLRPGDTVNVTLPTGPTEQHLVVSVDFDLGTGLMDVTTRLPDNTGTIGA